MNKIKLIQPICRTCMETNNLQPLQEDKTLLKILQTITDIDYSINDKLPQYICQSCINKLNDTLDFVTKCIDTNLAFKHCYIFLNKEEPSIEIKEEIDDIFEQEIQLVSEITVEDNIIKQEIKPEIVDDEDKLLECNICNKMFTNQKNLRRHKLTHNGQRNYKCEICLKSFGVSWSLIRHKRIHLNEKLFSCDICSKSFTDSSNLRQHKLIHSDERTFKCAVCLKTFKNYSTLRQHRFSHEKEGPFRCKICLKFFTRWSSLLRHHRRKHE